MTLATVIQQQLLQTLIAALGSGQSLDAGPSLKAGDIIEGKITGLNAKGEAELQTSKGTINVILPQNTTSAQKPALQLGQILKLEIAAPDQNGQITARIQSAGAQSGAKSATTAATVPVVVLASGTGLVENGRAVQAQAAAPRITAALITAPALQTQAGLAPLFANLSALAKSSTLAYLPTPVINAAAQVLSFRLPVDVPLTASGLKQAIATSGLFREAQAAAPGQPVDLKSALISLRLAIANALQSSALQSGLQTASEADKASLDTLPKAPADHAPRIASPGLETAQPAAPRRDSIPAAQGPAIATLDPEKATPEMILRTLSQQTEAALDRQTLLQVASLPPGIADIRHDGGAIQRWFSEIPLQLETRTPVLPLEIERDLRKRPGPDGDQPIWRVRFALDGEPMGILHALVMMQGRRLGITFWAERETTRAALRHASQDLSAALEGPLFSEAVVEVQAGAPSQPQNTGSGQFVDTRT
jgi:hypothetical protein